MRGFKQRKGKYLSETFAPTVSSSSVRLLSVIVCECDLDLCYFQGSSRLRLTARNREVDNHNVTDRNKPWFFSNRPFIAVMRSRTRLLGAVRLFVHLITRSIFIRLDIALPTSFVSLVDLLF